MPDRTAIGWSPEVGEPVDLGEGDQRLVPLGLMRLQHPPFLPTDSLGLDQDQLVTWSTGQLVTRIGRVGMFDPFPESMGASSGLWSSVLVQRSRSTDAQR